ncbi:hypothetical protein GFB49_11905 [Epibacterium sp. SM1979]|uniref:Uncharacterized protein n=1 Tax=Tritonibacter litoralis TaxID=2662264 RepID=A0A843YIS1_9RHOB|nr:hypothetical protein [Tritonibacter litoralis]MQQ09162.1 hypothetical protein [Tritonibacter litoralis]
MIWTGETHEMAATHCPKLGRPCPAALEMLQALSAAMTQAKPVTQDDFEMTGHSTLKACGAGCQARFVASHAQIRVFCDVSDSAEQKVLDQLADAMFSNDLIPSIARPSSDHLPCAVAQALPLQIATTRHIDTALRQPV